MKSEECRKFIDFSRMRGVISDRKIRMTELASITGIGYSSLQQLVYNMRLPSSEPLARICGVLECSVNDVMEFSGYEVDERYKVHRTGYYPPVYNEVTYEPLRQLFRREYGGGWKKKLAELFDNVEPMEKTESEEDRRNRIKKAHETLRRKGVEFKGGCGQRCRPGLTTAIRAKLNDDENVSLIFIYNICKVLRCTPDYVMDYK